MSEGDRDTMESTAFITEVEAQSSNSPTKTDPSRGGKEKKEKKKSQLLDQCRKENTKVKEVVDAFRTKIDNLIDKQRNEYIQAYENHMQDVQKELFTLRELAEEIANNSTKNEKTNKLKEEGKTYKASALELLAESDECRKHIRALVKRTYSVEKSRDWLLTKLRSAKKEHNVLQKTKNRIMESMDEMSVSQGSLGNSLGNMTDMMSQSVTSNYTLELEMRSKNKKRNKRVILSSSRTREKTEKEKFSSLLLPSLKSTAEIKPPKAPDPNLLIGSYVLPIGSKAERPAANGLSKKVSVKSQLLSARVRKEQIRDFLRLCATSLHKGPWNRVKKRDLPRLVNAANNLIYQRVLTDADFETHPAVLQLSCELASIPETYQAIIDVLERKVLPMVEEGEGEGEGEGEEEVTDEGGEEDEYERSGNVDGFEELFSQKLSTAGTGSVDHLDMPRGISPPKSPQQRNRVDKFKNSLEDILVNSGSRSVRNIPTPELLLSPNASRASSFLGLGGVGNKPVSMIDADLLDYLKQEKTNKALLSYGYFEDDPFLKKW